MKIIKTIKNIFHAFGVAIVTFIKLESKPKSRTPKEINKKKLKKGDLFIFGMLEQVWLVKKLKGKLRAVIISADSGWGHWEELDDIEDMARFKENNFQLIGNIYTDGKLKGMKSLKPKE